MRIEPFFVEQWMNAHETTATWNIAETCVHSLTLDELLELSGDADDGAAPPARDAGSAMATSSGSPRLRAAIAALYGERITADDVLTANGAIGANSLALLRPGRAGRRPWSASSPPTSSSSRCPSRLAPTCMSRAPARGRRLPAGRRRAPRRWPTSAPGSSCLNNPNNPTGALIDEPLLREIVEVARERDAWLLCDEVYRRLEHEPGTTAPSVADLYEKGVSSGSTSKSYSLAGLRTGWVAGPPELMAALPRHARLHDDQLRRARRRAGDGRARAPRRRSRAQPADRARQPRRGRRVARRRAPPALRAAARRHYRADPLRLRAALVRTSARPCSTSTAPSSCPAPPSTRSTPFAWATPAPATYLRAGWRRCLHSWRRWAEGSGTSSLPQEPLRPCAGKERKPATLTSVAS